MFLVYNPMVTTERQFDVKVEYHFFRKDGRPGAARRGGRRTRRHGRESSISITPMPQRFNPALMGAAFDPAAASR